MFTLSDKTKSNIKKSTGIDTSEITVMPHDTLDQKIEKKIGKKIKTKFIKTKGFSVRGNIYIALNRVLRESWLNKQMAKL